MSEHGLAQAAKAGEQLVDQRWQATGETTHGWRYTLAGGRAGYAFALQAVLANDELDA